MPDLQCIFCFFINFIQNRTHKKNPPQCCLLLLKRYVKPFCSWSQKRPCISLVISLTFLKERLSQLAPRVAVAFFCFPHAAGETSFHTTKVRPSSAGKSTSPETPCSFHPGDFSKKCAKVQLISLARATFTLTPWCSFPFLSQFSAGLVQSLRPGEKVLGAYQDDMWEFVLMWTDTLLNAKLFCL